MASRLQSRHSLWFEGDCRQKAAEQAFQKIAFPAMASAVLWSIILAVMGMHFRRLLLTSSIASFRARAGRVSRTTRPMPILVFGLTGRAAADARAETAFFVVCVERFRC